MNNSGYTQGSAPAGNGNAAASDGMSHDKLKKQYLSYLGTKSEEIKEQQDSRRYYHGSQWTAKQIKTFNLRKQPVVTFNRIGRKINAVVGLLAKQRQDPRGFPRTANDEQGAELATAVLRYVCDAGEWPSKDPICGLNGAIDGIGGVEIVLEQGDQGDNDVGFEIVDPSGFFYDPRSMRADFSDARFMGLGKWADVETVIEMFPDNADDIRAAVESGSDLTSNPDSDTKWFDTQDGTSKLRLVDHWYIEQGVWNYCLYTGSVELMRGPSFLVDEKKKPVCKFIMFSASVDQDGDRYGFVRNMKSAQDEINQRRSKGLHQLSSRRLIIQDGTGIDVEEVRREAVRPDGVIKYPAGSEPPVFDDNARGQELTGQLAFLEDAKQEIENYGFNPALMGTGVQDMSGRAIQLQQQAGIAELGPYMLAYKGWKLRVYRTIWNAVRQYWTAERWVRVTDDEGAAQFFAVNQMVVDPNTGMPVMQNQIGALDVDIIIDEGPDTINMQADAYDTLTVMARNGQNVPQELLIELSPLTGSVKKKAKDIIAKSQQQAQQAQMPAMQLEMQGKQVENQKTQAETAKIVAETQQMGNDAQTQMMDARINAAEAERKRAADGAKSQVELLKASYGLKGQEMDLAGKALALRAAQTQANQPQQRGAA